MPELSWTLIYEQEGKTYTRSGKTPFTDEVHIREDFTGTIVSAEASVLMHAEDEASIFMNGYQTWTYCPEYRTDSRIRGLHGLPKFGVDRFALDRYGDYHFVEYPNKKGILHGFSWGYIRHGEKYRFFGSLNERTGYTMFTYAHQAGVLMIRKDAEGVCVNGTYDLFDLYFTEGNETEVFDSWFERLQITPRITQKLTGYSSWYNRYQNIDAQSITQDLAGCKTVFEQGDLFQIDDGWEPYVGDWLVPDAVKFPQGLKGITEEIHSLGYKAGLWLAPFVAEEKSSLYHDHPDWFLKHAGEPWKCGSNWSGFYALDIDHPEVQAYLKESFRRVFDEWGFDLVKLDFLYGAAPFGNERESRAGRMYRAMEMLREWCGDHLILGCGVPVMPAFGIVDYCRISCDVSLDWNDKPYMRIIHRERVSTKQAVGNILSRRELNGRAYLSDPDVFFLRTENLKLSEEQKVLLAKVDALLGGVWLISDDPGRYTPEQKALYKELRQLLQAENVKYDPDRKQIRYVLNGEPEVLDISLFTGR